MHEVIEDKCHTEVDTEPPGEGVNVWPEQAIVTVQCMFALNYFYIDTYFF